MRKSYNKKLILSGILTFLQLQGCAALGGGSGNDYPEKLRDHPNRSVRYGMSMNTVRSAWGDPRHVQIAGSGMGGNERWIYTESNVSNYESSPTRVVYFENGKVIGWETTRVTQMR